MLTLYIDADACPVKAETLQVASRYGLEVYIVSNSGLRPVQDPNVHMITVEAGPDVADDWIAERVEFGDIAITADILLAERCLKQSAQALNPNGKAFTADNIAQAVAGRSLNAHLREMGDVGHNPAFSKQNRSRFLQQLDAMIQTVKRQQ